MRYCPSIILTHNIYVKVFPPQMETENLAQSLTSSSMQGTTAKRTLLADMQRNAHDANSKDNQEDKAITVAIDNPINKADFWYAAMVQSNCENIVAKQISSIDDGIVTWVAAVDEKVRDSRGKKRERTNVVLHSYVFFQLPTHYQRKSDKYAPLLEVKKLSKVHGLVMRTDREYGEWEGAHIPDEQIERLRFIIRASENPVGVITKQRYVKGDEVRVIRGNLTGLQGTVCKDDDGKTRIYVALDYIGYATTEILRSDVEFIRRRRGRPCKELR